MCSNGDKLAVSDAKYQLDDLACFLCLSQRGDEAAASGAKPDAPKPAAAVAIGEDLELRYPVVAVSDHDFFRHRRRRYSRKQQQRRAPSVVFPYTSTMASITMALLDYLRNSDARSLLTCCSTVRSHGGVARMKHVADSVARKQSVERCKQSVADSVAALLQDRRSKLIRVVGLSVDDLSRVQRWALHWLDRIPSESLPESSSIISQPWR